MERLLLLRLRSSGCAAEASINDIVVARTLAAGGEVSVPVHEVLLEGDNDLTLVLDPTPPGAAPAPRMLDAPIAAGLRLLLPRVGQVGSESSARTLARFFAEYERVVNLLVEHPGIGTPMSRGTFSEAAISRWRGFSTCIAAS